MNKGFGCHGLGPWSFTIVSTTSDHFPAGCHGLVPWRFTLAAARHQREPPRHKAVASKGVKAALVDGKREPPRHKTVASRDREMPHLKAVDSRYHNRKSRRLFSFPWRMGSLRQL